MTKDIKVVIEPVENTGGKHINFKVLKDGELVYSITAEEVSVFKMNGDTPEHILTENIESK